MEVNEILTLVFLLGALSITWGAEEPKPDVETIVNKANNVAYYQGNDGKAKVNMVITGKSGNKRKRELPAI